MVVIYKVDFSGKLVGWRQVDIKAENKYLT